MEGVYVYKKLNSESNQYFPQWDSIEVERAIKNGRAIKRYVKEVPKITTSELFEKPILEFIVEKDLIDAVDKLNADYFKSKFLEELLFLIVNLQAKYALLIEPVENTDGGLIYDYATIDKDRRELIKGLTKFIKKYKTDQQTKGGTIKELKLSFNDKDFKIKNFLVIDDILSSYLAHYGFKYDNPTEWEENINNALPRFDVNKFADDFRRKLCTSFIKWFNDLSGIKNIESTPNEFIKPLNIIFSLASIPVNDSTIFYEKNVDFQNYFSTPQINVLRNWINRSDNY